MDTKLLKNLNEFAKQVGIDVKSLRTKKVIINNNSNWETSSLKSDFKMVRIDHDFVNPIVNANNVTTGIISNPVFYLKIEKNKQITLHVAGNNYTQYYANGKIEIHLTIFEQ